MKSIDLKKDKLFKGILEAVHRDLKLYGDREAKIVSLTFEKTFLVVNKIFDTELRKNYLKRTKPRYSKKVKPSRLQNVE